MGGGCGAVYCWGLGLVCGIVEGNGCEDDEDFEDEWCISHAEKC